MLRASSNKYAIGLLFCILFLATGLKFVSPSYFLNSGYWYLQEVYHNGIFYDTTQLYNEEIRLYNQHLDILDSVYGENFRSAMVNSTLLPRLNDRIISLRKAPYDSTYINVVNDTCFIFSKNKTPLKYKFNVNSNNSFIRFFDSTQSSYFDSVKLIYINNSVLIVRRYQGNDTISDVTEFRYTRFH